MLPQHVRPFVQSLRRRPRSTRYSSFEKLSIETFSIAEATGPASASSEVSVSADTLVDATAGHYPEVPTLSKLPHDTTGSGPPSAEAAASPQSEIAAGQTGGTAALDLELPSLSRVGSLEATGSSTCPLAPSEAADIGRVLSSVPPEVQSDVMRFVRSLLSRRAWHRSGQTEMDSGMRFAEDMYEPPPDYTAE